MDNYYSLLKFIRVHRETNAFEGPNAFLSGAKTWTRRRKIGGGAPFALGAHRPLPLVPPSSLAPNEPYLNLFSLPSHAPGSSKREVINHCAINNQYFSSNVYRVRFKCLVKTNLRPYDGGLRPFCLAPLVLHTRAHSAGIYHGRAPT